ncbi:MAG TPA: hypothetical protein VG269_26835 [Tepidisphaeraceae bacterium]|jgi:N12 class adenine-specific DNA methylase|nr:hypothetical protein [Tepidisphaeraceae bacterium]
MPEQDPWAQMAASMQPAANGATAPAADRPTPEITGDSNGVSLQTKVDPWEQEAAKFNLDAARAGGQNLVPALQAADRVGGLPAEQPKPIPQIPTLNSTFGVPEDTGQAGFQHDLHHGGIVSELLEPEMYAKARWADQFGNAALASERPQVEAWAKANRPGREVDPELAAEYVRSTVDPALAEKYDNRFKMEHALYHAVQVRDQMAQQVAADWKADYPNAHGPEADQEMYRAVQQQMLRLGVPEDKLPPFTVQGGTVQPVEVGRMHGWVDNWLKGSGDLAYGPAQAVEGAGQTLADRFGGGKPGASAGTGFFEGMRQNTAASAQRYEQLLPNSTKQDAFQQITEGGLRMAPQLIAAALTGRAALPGGSLFGVTGASAKTLASVLEGSQFFAQTAGQSYQGVYDAAVKDGKTKEQASLAAGVGSVIDGAVAVAGMKFGALGQMQSRGLRTYLANTIRAAGAQGGVAAVQDLTSQLTHYVASGGKEALDVDRILKAGLQGAAAGAFTMASDPSRVRAAWDTFRSAPAGDGSTAERMAGKFGDVGMGREDATNFLGLKKGYTADDVRDAFREKIKEAHPDAGGNQELFAKTMAARAAALSSLNGTSPSPTEGRPSGSAGDNGRQPATGDGGPNQTPPPASATSVPEAQPPAERGSGNAGVGAQITPADSAVVTTPGAPSSPTTPPPPGGAAVQTPAPAVGGDAAERARLTGIINSAGVTSLNKQDLGTATTDQLRNAVEKLKDGGAARQVRKFLDGIAPRDAQTGERNYPPTKVLLDELKGNQALLEQLKAERQKHESLAQEVQRLDSMYGPGRGAGDDIIGRVRAENRAPLERLENEGGKQEPVGTADSAEGPGKNHPRELADAHAVGEWYAKQFGEPENAGTIEALASMSKGKYVLAEVPAGKIDPSSLIAGDKDQGKVDALNKLTPEQRAALPPAILVAGPKGGGLMVADGSHRTLSAQQSGYPTVRAYVPERYIGQHGIERVTGTVEVEHRAKTPAEEPGGARAPTPDTSGRDNLEKKGGGGEGESKLTKHFDTALHGALHGVSGSAERWDALRRTGADDETLKNGIAKEFGIDGGANGATPEESWRAKGGNNPKFWQGAGDHGSRPTLTGKRLVDEVRRLMEIPLPGQESGTLGGDGREQREPDALPEAGRGPAAGGAVGAGGEGALGTALPDAAPAAQPGGPTGQRGAGGREERAGPLQPAGEPGSGPAVGAGGREGASHLPDRLGERGREPDAGGSEPGQGAAAGVVREVAESDAQEQAPALTGNHTITDAAKLDAGGARTKYQQNVAAIETLRRVMAEGRRATAAEQEVLALYSGWGRFPQLFNAAAAVGAEGKSEGKASAWEQESKDVKDLLTPEEWEAARKSTLNAHYSSPLLAVSMWQGMRRLGFAGGGRVLEPSMGAGIFFGLMPPDMRDGSRLTGVELDPITGNIARLLYPEANVQVKGFEQLVAPPGFFDAAIGNVPFGDYPLHDPAYKQLRTAPIHDYFIVKTLDLTRPGGVVALITSTGTMDKAEGRFRAMMREKADLVAAVRLPEGAFEKSAGTSVVTDLLIFKRRGEGEAPAGPDFQGLKELPDPDGGAPIPVNTYFADNPEQILGTLDRKSRLYGRGDMHVSRTADFQKRLADAIDRLPAGVYKPAAAAHLGQPPRKAAPGSVKDGAYVKQGKKLFRRQGGELVEAEGDKKNLALIADTMLVRDALRELIDAELASKSADEVQRKREQLGRAYDEFVKKRGPLRKRSNVQAFADDPDAPVVQALEASYDPKTGEATKADVFTKSTVRGYDRPAKAGTVGEALGITLNETGHVDIARVAALLGKGQDDAGDELVKAGLAFRDPAGGWKSAEQYLGGNVKKKLLEAREAAAGEKQYAANVEALDKVQPADVPHDEIDLRLGAGWVPASDVRDFAQSMMGGIAEHFSVRYIPQQGTWLANYTDTGLNRHKHSPNDATVWGTDRAGFIEVFEAALNNKSLTITDPVPGDKDKRVVNKEATAAANEKVEKVQQAFRDWVWEGDERRQRLHRFYNDTFNNLAPVKFDGSHLTFPGMNPAISLRAHQGNAVWQTISTGIGLYGHEVGTGKTFTMAAAAVELRRLGLARKPAIATIKAAFETVVKQTRALYPSAKVLAVDSFDAKGRKAAVARIATGDWDVVVLTHDQLDMLPMDPEVEAGFIRKELAELEEVKRSVEGEDTGQAYGRGRGRGKKNDNRMVKALEKIKARLEARLKEAIDSKKDNAVTFEQTGIDHLFVDEAHRYKSLPVYTKQDRVKGIPKSRSDRATNMWMRTQWLQQMNNGRGVVFATGTPVTNTMAELYTMQRYLQMRELESRGVAAFDAWASTFGRLVTKMEYTVTGDYAPSTRFAAFTNMPELQQIARQVIDIQRAKDMPGFQRPKRVDEVVKAPMSREQSSYLNEIKDRAREAKKKRPGEKGDNMLSISMDARKSALDHRIIDHTAPDFGDSKTNQIVRNVLKFHAAHPGTTQMIFSDLGISQNEGGFSFYESLIDKLVQGGIPRDKIINFGDLTDAQKRDAADRLAAGDALVGIGGSEKLGTGVNAQQRLVALHHADVPWVPAFVEQRDGRGWRQGNANPTGKIHIFRYVTEGSFDTFMWQAVDAKTKFINQFMEGKKIARAISEDDGEELSPAQVMAIASGNPLLLTRIQLDKDVQDLTAAANRHQRDSLRLRDDAAKLRGEITDAKGVGAKLAPDLATATKHGEDKFSIEIDGKSYADRGEAQDALDKAVESIPPRGTSSDKRVPLGTYRGFPLEGYRSLGSARVVLVGANTTYDADSSVGSIEYRARQSTIQGMVDRSLQLLRVYEADLAKLLPQIGKPFPRAADLEAKQKQLRDVTTQLAAANDTEPAKAAATPARGESEGERDLDDEGAGAYSRVSEPTPLPILHNSVAVHGPAAAGGRKLLRPMEMPELLKLARSIMQTGAPVMKKLRGSVAGKFKSVGGFGTISIDPRKVKGAREIAAALAHEVGHLEDWLPLGGSGNPPTLSRGNVVGSIAKLNRHLAATWRGAVGPNQALRKQLIALSEWWSPYDKAKAKASYIQYRESPRELYAELLSVLLNAPGEVEARAPLAYKQFLEHLDRHAEFRDAYLTLQDVLAGTPQELAAGRRKDIREAYARGEDILKARAKERATNRTSIIGAIKQILFDRSAPVLDLQKTAEKKIGTRLPEALNAKYALGELAYSDNTNHLMLRRLEEEVVAPVKRAGMGLPELGEYLQLHRTATERSDLANPQGHTPATAAAMLKDLEREVGPVRYAALEKAITTFHDIIFEAVDHAGDVGTYSREKVTKELEPNKYNYATFAVLDYLDEHISHAIIQQHGTFKDVANPFVSTVMKTMSLNRMNDLQEAKNTTIRMMLRHFPTDITKGRARHGPGGMPLPPGKPPRGREWLPVYEDGKLRHYAVDPYVAKVFANHDIGMLATVGRWLSLITYRPFHPLYVTWNVGWAMGLTFSDFQRTWRNNAIKGKPVGLREILKAYRAAAPIAYRRVQRRPDATIDAMLEAKALDVPWMDFEFHDEHDTFARMLDRYGLGDKPVKKGGVIRAAVKWMQNMQHAVEGMGSFVVSVPKIAGWQMLAARGIPEHERAYRVRNFMGHPDRKRKGLATVLTNPVFMYSNILIQFLRADAEAATEPTTRAGFWLRWGLSGALPKILMRLAAAGLMGAGLKALFAAVPESDKQKGTVIPYGWARGPKGELKARYFLIPTDPWNRLMGGLLWKLTGTDDETLLHRMQGVLDAGYSDAPHISPTLQMANNWQQYLRGQNPYDDFRRRNIISDDDFKAGGWYANKDMLSWTGNQFGQASVLAHWLIGKSEGLGERETTGEKVVGSVPGLSRFLKTSDRGIREKEELDHTVEDAEAARFRLSLPDEVRNLVRERYRLELEKENISDDDRERRAELSHWYGSTYLRLTKEIKAAEHDKDADSAKELRAALLESAKQHLKE